MGLRLEMLDAIIFDCDGVIVDTEPLHSQAWVELLKNYGKTPKRFENGLVHQVGVTIDDNILPALQDVDLNS